jgi:hypothetical protein
MELVLKTSEQKCFVGSNPTASAINLWENCVLEFCKRWESAIQFRFRQPTWLSNLLLFSVFSATIAYLGSFGRIVADEYCMCSRLIELGDNPIYLALEFNGFVGMFIQATLAHWTIINFGQGAGFALVWVLLLWAIWFFSYSLLKTSPSLSAKIRFQISGILAFGLIIFLSAPAGFVPWRIYEALTQQAFIAQTLFRYPGLVSGLAASFLLLGLVLLLSINSASAGKKSMVAAYLVGLLAGSMGYYLAAIVVFTILYTNKQVFLRIIGRGKPGIVSVPGLLLAGLATSLFFSLTSAAALSRISSMSTENSLTPPGERALYSLLDAFWFGSSLFTVPMVLGFLLGWLVQWKFGLMRFLTFGFKDLRSLTAFLSLFMFIILTVAAFVSYSAPWHLLLPRSLALLLSMAWGVLISSRIFTQAESTALSQALRLFPILLLTYLGVASAFNWAHKLPENWERGPLPLQTVNSGPGSGIIWSDTEDPINRECYLKIQNRLKEKKSYLDD